MNKRLLILQGITAVFLISCEKEIELDIPAAEDQLVVEGKIENGQAPIVILTESRPYFSETNVSSLEQLFVHNALVEVTVNNQTIKLQEYCSGSLPYPYLVIISLRTGIPVETLQSFNFCAYSLIPVTFSGESGKEYRLKIYAKGKTLSAKTTIPYPMKLDSVWFQPEAGLDSLGYAWAHLSDPDTLGNAYRWFAKRSFSDDYFIAPLGSVFEDKFFNGQSFDFFYQRGLPDKSPAGGYFKKGEEIKIKFCSIDREHYKFWRSYETQLFSNGNPFAATISLQSNILGGLGVWGGYGVVYHTFTAQ